MKVIFKYVVTNYKSFLFYNNNFKFCTDSNSWTSFFITLDLVII
jgi:hypothetical protein